MTAHVLEMDYRHRYKCVTPEHKGQDCDGKVFQSVTTILGKAVPKNLTWHGQTRGVIGVKGLLKIPKYDVRNMKTSEIVQACAKEGILSDPSRVVSGAGISPADRVKLSAIPKYDIARLSPNAITEALRREHLTVNDHMNQAAEGGTAVHKALEDYADKGIIPSAAQVPESKRGSMIGLARFIVEYKPEIIQSEGRVLSVKHGYAGTYDLLCQVRVERHGINNDGPPVTNSRGALIPNTRIEPITVLADLKTSKYVYPASHFPQLEAYEGARVEAGEPATDVRAVLWVNADGNMELVPSSATFEDFLALKASAEVIGRLDRSWKRPRKARA